MGKAYLVTYEYDVELAYNPPEGESVEILKEGLIYMMIKHDYSEAIMPIIYMNVRLLPSVYNKMVEGQGKGKIYLKLYRTRKLGATSSAPKKVIYDEFDFYMTDDPNSYRKMDTIGEESGSVYRTCFIGLVKLDLQTKNRKSFEGVYKNTNSMSLIQSATKDFKMVIQPFDNNSTFNTFVCPTVTSIGQFISYVNSRASFYKGSYMYYMDFDKTYLRSNDGSYIDANDGDFKYIAFDVRDLTSYRSLSSGMVEDPDQDSYIVYLSGDDVQIIIDRVTSNLVGSVTGIDNTDGAQVGSIVNTSNITSIGSQNSNMIYISQDKNAAKNYSTRIAEMADTMIISKLDMDSRAFTPNKTYMLCNYEDNPKYCGIYYMTRKEELYLRSGESMNCQMTVTFRKTADFV